MADIVTFDAVNLRIIEIDAAGDNVSNAQEIYSEWKDWLLADPQRQGLPPAFRIVSDSDIAPGKTSVPYFFLRTDLGWQLRPAESDHKWQVVGNMFPEGGVGSIFVPTLGAFTVNAETEVSPQGLVITQAVGGLVTTLQEVRDAMKLAASGGAPADGSIDTKLDDLGYIDGVWVDPMNGSPGTVLGVNGLRGNPVDTIADALTIATAANVRQLQFVTGTFTITQSLTEFVVIGGAEVEVNLNGQNVNATNFENVTLKGTMSGAIVAVQCPIEDVTGLLGEFHRCRRSGTNTLGAGQSTFHLCYSGVPGSGLSTLAFVPGASANIRAEEGGLKIENMTDAGNICTIDMNNGQLEIDSSCTDGVLVTRGRIGRRIDNSTGTLVIDQRRPDARVSIISDGATPDNIEILAWLEREGEPVTKDLVSASVTFREPDGTIVFGPTALTLDAVRGVFRASVAAISLADATNYYADLTITDASGAVQAYQAQPTLA